MAKLGFLGLGLMGKPMAGHLLAAGHEVALWSHTDSKARDLADAHGGGAHCVTPAQVGAFAECIFLCVGDSAMSEEVLTGGDGVLSGAAPGTIVADCSTIGPSTARRIAAKFEAKGCHYLDSPCTGSTPGAEGGTLTFMIGGDEQVFGRARPYFECMGKNLYYCGSQGMGLHAKLSQNLVLANMLQGFIEGMVLSTKAGVPPKLMFEILDNSAAKSGLIAFKAPYVFQRDFEPAFPLKWMRKDIGLMLESGRELGVPLPSTGLVHELFSAGVAKGHGDEDIIAAIKLFEDLAGVRVKAPRYFKDLVEDGYLRVGWELTVRGYPDKKARVTDGRDGSEVEFEGERMSCNRFGRKVTGYDTYATYKQTLQPNGRPLEDLR